MTKNAIKYSIFNIQFSILIALVLIGCKTKERIVTIEHTQHDTTYVAKMERDSIWLHDSIYVREWMKGDTVFVQKTQWRDRWRDRIIRDTSRVVRVDSVPVPYPVIEEVERQLTWWQKTRIHGGEVLLALLGIGGVIGILKIRKKLPF